MPPKRTPVSLSTDAEADANAAVDWYIGEGALSAAEDFADAIDQALGLLSQFNKLGETGEHNTRTLSLYSFPLFSDLPSARRYDSHHCRCPSQPPTRVLGWATLTSANFLQQRHSWHFGII